jgi:ribulose 1,5-bisphosphate carboxylase large subunit-like protein
MKEMQTMFAQMTSQQQPVQNITQYIGENNKDVVVTSLTVGQLNLSTEGYGQGEIYTFEHIGEEQSIPLEDLKKIIKNNKSFVEGGNFFINDDEVVKSQKLTNIYKKLLSYDEMLDLFNKDRSVFEKVFANMTANQKETLKRIIFEKLNENEKSVDMNIVQVINDNLGIDIMDDFRNQKRLSEILKNDN